MPSPPHPHPFPLQSATAAALQRLQAAERKAETLANDLAKATARMAKMQSAEEIKSAWAVKKVNIADIKTIPELKLTDDQKLQVQK